MRLLLALLLTALLAAPATATGATAAPPLQVSSVRTAVTAADPGDRLSISGAVVNRGKRAARGRVTVALRPGAGSSGGRIMARRTLARLRPGRRASYRIRGTVPAGLAARRYRVVVCVRVGNRAADCATAARRLTVRRPAPEAAPPTVPPAPTTTPEAPGAVAPVTPPVSAGGGGGGASPAGPTTPSLVVRDGVTQRAFSYRDAIRERAFVQTDFDSDRDGRNDRIAVDVIRPAETAAGMKVPVIMVASPYFSMDDPFDPDAPPDGSLPPQHIKRDIDGDGRLDVWPGFYDNFFVPRGYAVALVDSTGTGRSTGCPTTGGPDDVRGSRLVVDWLNGRARAYTAVEGGARTDATWTTGKTGMIGLSYVGTLANAVAATGVEGLETIVPQAAISNWYGYYRSGGLRYYADDGPEELARSVTNPDRRIVCEFAYQSMADRAGSGAGVDTANAGNDNEFWRERDYVAQAGNVHASVFMVNGMNDLNVKPLHAGSWWSALAAHDVPRKAWLAQGGHLDPADTDTEAWLPVLHRWFDHWLADVDNGIMDEPMVTIEGQPVAGADATTRPTFFTDDEWPSAGARQSTLWLGSDGSGGTSGPGTLASARDATPIAPVTWVDDPAERVAPDPWPNALRPWFEPGVVADPDLLGDNRAIFLTEPLAVDTRISGQSMLTARLALDSEPDDPGDDGEAIASASVGAMLVDYGPSIETVDSTDGYGAEYPVGGPEYCLPEEDGTAYDSHCLPQMVRKYRQTDAEVVAKGVVDVGNRNSLEFKTAMAPGAPAWVKVPLWTKDYTFPAGHRLGLVLVGSYPDFASVPPYDERLGYQLTTADTSLSLPIVGGAEAAGL